MESDDWLPSCEPSANLAEIGGTVPRDENEVEEVEFQPSAGGGWVMGERKREERLRGGEADGIAFVLVVSFGLGNFGRWLVRGAQSGLPDLT
ncbi:hypothetical protein K0M31_003695 [Melipona bicolor]|uniref:Uncharacterized protein n=1 Tax=Melipona bicolor TaxID=60889 RepID=A0AA40FXG9_9HYME|nr:hypothetical protein K0M31_003695 [Melipona bicolor]